MFSPLWMRSLLHRLLGCPSTGKPPALRRMRRAHLLLEALEERVTPSVMVTTTQDLSTPIAGQLSLREAINMVNAGQVADNTIILPAGTYQNTQGALNITHSLILQGAGSGSTIIDGGGTDRVILIDPSTPVTVQLSGVTVQNGKTTGDGGGIDVSDTGAASTLTVQSCLITNNMAGSGNGFNYGGGIAGDFTDINVVDSQVVGNEVLGMNGSGGGIADGKGGTGNVTVTDSLIADNSAAGGGGGGIGLPFEDTGSLTVTGSTIKDNTLTGANLGGGGGIFAETIGAVSITNTTIEGNTSLADGGGFSESFDSPKNLVLSNDTIENNQSTQGNGGGIAYETAHNLTIQNCTLSGNTASKAGGGLFLGNSVISLTLQDSTINGNTAGTSGGGVEDEASFVTATNCVLDNNKANTVNGGGLDVADGTNQTVGLNNVTFRGNSVVGGSFFAGTGFGGGLFAASSAGSIQVANCLFVDNTAVSQGGGLAQSQGSLNVSNSQFTGNTDSGEDGGGGALAFDGSFYVITGSTFDNNTSANNGGAVSIIANPSGMSPNSLLLNDTFTGNTADQGGAIDMGGNEPVLILNDTLAGNSAMGSESVGGGILATSPVTLQNTIIAGNTSPLAPDIELIGQFTDNGDNLIGSTSGFGGTLGSTDLVGVNPLLGPLANNGGILAGASSDQQVVQTEALLPGSPAIGKGVANGAAPIDERGFPVVTPLDIGAFQFQNVPLTVTVTPATSSVLVNGSETFMIAVTNTGGIALPADNSMLTITLSAGLTATGPLTFTLAALPAGQSQTFTVTATATMLGTQTLTATVTSPDANPNSINGNATVDVVMTPPTIPLPPKTTTNTPIGSLTLFAFGFGPTGIDLFEVDSAGDIFAVPFMGGGAPLFLNTSLQLPIAVVGNGQLLALLEGSNGQDYIIDIVNPFNTFIEPAVLAALTHG